MQLITPLKKQNQTKNTRLTCCLTQKRAQKSVDNRGCEVPEVSCVGGLTSMTFQQQASKATPKFNFGSRKSLNIADGDSSFCLPTSSSIRRVLSFSRQTSSAFPGKKKQSVFF